PIDRSRDLDAAIEEVLRQRRDAPARFAHLLRRLEEVEALASIEPLLQRRAAREERFDAVAERAFEGRDEREHVAAENVVVDVDARADDAGGRTSFIAGGVAGLGFEVHSNAPRRDIASFYPWSCRNKK